MKLSALATVDSPTAIDYYLSNNGGAKWYLVQRDKLFIFPSVGNDLRWRAEFSSKSPVRTAKLMQIDLITDSMAPEVTISDVPINSNTAFTATFTFDEAVTGFDATDVVLGNATKGNFTASSATLYTLVINPIANGNVTVDVPEDGAFNMRNNGNTAALQAVSAFFNTPPGVVITGVPINSNTAFTATFTFSEPVTGFDATDVALINANKGLFTTLSSTNYTLLITPIVGGFVTVNVADNRAFDISNSGNTAALQAISLYDPTKLSVIVNMSGLSGDMIVISNAGESANITSNGPQNIFALDDGSGYNLNIDAQPNTPSQTCSFTNSDNSGTINGSEVIINMNCITNTYFVGGTLSGLLRGNSVELQNNSTDDKIMTSNGTFIFDMPLLDLSPYDVSVKTDPVSPLQTCAVINNSGAFSGNNVIDIEVICEYLLSNDLIYRDGFEDDGANQ